MTTDIATQKEELVDKHFERMDLVVTEYLKGSTVQEISKTVGLSSHLVHSILKEWRGLASNNELMKERATLALRNVDTHYDKLIHIAYGILADAELSNSISQRLSAVKAIADMEKVRIDLLQKAGVLEDNQMANKIMETERKQAILIEILKETVGPCPRCRGMVQEKLSQITNEIVILRADDA
jgi:hypothetical protein